MVDAQTELETIQGYRAISVTRTASGTQEEVRIKELNVYELQAYALCYGDQGKTVELFCGKEPGWAGFIPYRDVQRILDIGVEINDPIFTQYVERDGKILERMVAVLSKQVEKRALLNSLLDGSASRLPSSPESPLPRSSNGPLPES